MVVLVLVVLVLGPLPPPLNSQHYRFWLLADRAVSAVLCCPYPPQQQQQRKVLLQVCLIFFYLPIYSYIYVSIYLPIYRHAYLSIFTTTYVNLLIIPHFLPVPLIHYPPNLYCINALPSHYHRWSKNIPGATRNVPTGCSGAHQHVFP